jgi:transposase-like protein
VEEGLTIERIAQRLGIGDTTVRHWLKRHGLKTVGGQRRDALAYARLTGQERFELRCRRHGLVEHVVLRSETRLRCTKCRAEAVARRRRKVKAILVAEAGGKCVMCGYAGHPAGLQFHHVSPGSKAFGLGVRGITRSIAKLREEASKCVLLCATCHALVSAGVAEVPVELSEP